MEKHVAVLAIIFIAFGAMGLMGAAIVTFIFLGGGILGGAAAGEPGVMLMITTIGIAITTVILITSLPEIIAGIGLLKFKSWARILGIIVAILELFAFPIGTAVGIYGLWVLIHDDTVRLFREETLHGA